MAAFTLNYIMIYAQSDLSQLQKISYKNLSINGIFQNGNPTFNEAGTVMCFYDPVQK